MESDLSQECRGDLVDKKYQPMKYATLIRQGQKQHIYISRYRKTM